MEDFWNNLYATILPQLADLAETAATLLIPVIMWQVKSWLTSRIHSASFNCAMEKITATLETATLNVAHTYVRDVKVAGAWDGTAATNAKAMAIQQGKEMLGKKGLAEIKGCLGLKDEDALNSLMERVMESVLAKSKLAGLISPKGEVPAPAALPGNEGSSDPNATTVRLTADFSPADSGPVGPSDSKT